MRKDFRMVTWSGRCQKLNWLWVLIFCCWLALCEVHLCESTSAQAELVMPLNLLSEGTLQPRKLCNTGSSRPGRGSNPRPEGELLSRGKRCISQVSDTLVGKSRPQPLSFLSLLSGSRPSSQVCCFKSCQGLSQEVYYDNFLLSIGQFWELWYRASKGMGQMAVLQKYKFIQTCYILAHNQGKCRNPHCRTDKADLRMLSDSGGKKFFSVWSGF